MAKSPTEQIRDLALEVRALREKDEYQDREIVRLRDEVTKEREARIALERENADLKRQIQDHIKRVELWSNRGWALIMVLVGTLCSVATGLIIAFARK